MPIHAVLTDFHCLRPPHETAQEKTLEWIAEAHTQAEAKAQGWQRSDPASSTFHEKIQQRLFKIGFGPDKIQNRGLYSTDFFHFDWNAMQIYNLDKDPRGGCLKERTQLFDTAASAALEQFFPEGASPPSHLIHVTCTGYLSPSAAQKVVSKRDFGERTIVTHAYHMGCYASIPALRMAAGFCSCEKNSVDIVHTELCSLHMNPLLHESEQLVVQTLFADGFIKYTLSSESSLPHLSILALHEETIPDSLSSMTWSPESWGMRMFVAKEVPILIGRAIKRFLAALIEKAQREIDLSQALFAVHPGGPKIIQQVGEVLHLRTDQLSHSQAILQSCGNMSSATLPHIWQKMLLDPTVSSGTYIVSLAFGPGLSIAGALFQKA